MFVGKHQHGPYALPSLVDSATTVSNNIGHLSLEVPLLTSHIDEAGNEIPLPGDYVFIPNVDSADDSYQSVEYTKNMLGNQIIDVHCIHCSKAINKALLYSSFIIALYKFHTFCNLDYYNILIGYQPQNQFLQITGRSDPIILETTLSNVTELKLPTAMQSNISNNTVQSESIHNWQKILLDTYSTTKVWINQQENTGIKLVLIIFAGCMIAALWYLYVQNKQQLQQLSQVKYLIYYALNCEIRRTI